MRARHLALLSLLIPMPLLAQAPLLVLPAGSAGAALGEAVVTEASAFSPFLNPAGMGAVVRAEGGGSVLRVAGRTATLASGVVPLGARLRLGGYAGLFAAPDPLVDPVPGESPPNQFQSGLVGGAASVQLGRVHAGAGAKLFTEDAGNDRFTWLAYDAGVLAAFGGGDVVVGAALKNFGTAFIGPQRGSPDCTPQGPCPLSVVYELPSSWRLGGAWRAFTVREADAGTALGHVRLLGEYVSNSFEATTLNLGVEADAFDAVTLRAGWIEPLDSPGLDEEGRWTIGAGVRFGRLRADVALLPELGFDADPGVSFGVRLAR
jgi:hypothetical protein